jgi:hypothetical protein
MQCPGVRLSSVEPADAHLLDGGRSMTFEIVEKQTAEVR